eukprot:1137191-Pelagomonas_calceolata.AAC.10
MYGQVEIIGPASSSCTQQQHAHWILCVRSATFNLPASKGSGRLLEVAPTNGSTVTALSCSTAVNTTCDDNDLMVLMYTAYKQDPQPIVPTSSCTCYAPPDGDGDCPFPQIPITLETVTSNASLGISYQQCIDPANFDY